MQTKAAQNNHLLQILIYVYVFTFFYIILSTKYLSTDPQSMQKCSLQDNDVLFHMATQKHTIKIKYKDHPSINVYKKGNFKPLNCNNRYEI